MKTKEQLAEEYAKREHCRTPGDSTYITKIEIDSIAYHFLSGYTAAVEACLEILDQELGDNHYSVTEKIKALLSEGDK